MHLRVRGHGYEQKAFAEEGKRGRLQLVGSRDGRDGSLTIHQDVDLYATSLSDDDSVQHRLGRDRKAWMQLTRGTVTLNGQKLSPGDGVAFEGPEAITLTGLSDAEALLFDMGG